MSNVRSFHTSPFWACISILAFPIGIFVSCAYGFGQYASFFAGMCATLIVLTLNAIFEKRLWIFEPQWKKHLEHPEFSFRLLIITGALLLFVETALLINFIVRPETDRALLNLIFERQCSQPHPGYESICEAIQQMSDEQN